MVIINGPGIYDGVPFAEYHGDCAADVSVSASTLIQLDQRCPAYAWARYYLHPSPVESEDTEATALGTAAHKYILEGPAAFGDEYVLRPDGIDGRTKAGKEWLEAHARFKIVKADDFAVICAMAKAVADNPASRNAFTGGAPEQTLIVRDDETGIWLKARPDYLRGNLALNLKTTINAKREVWERQAAALGYFVSAALSIDVMAAIGIERPLYGFVIVEKEPPYSVAVRVFDDSVIDWGRMIYRRALRTFAECIKSGVWPAYGETVETVGLPAWAERTLEKRHEAGEFTPEILMAG